MGYGTSDMACELRVRIKMRLGTVRLPTPCNGLPGEVATGLPDGAASSSCSEKEWSLTGAITCVERASASERSPCC